MKSQLCTISTLTLLIAAVSAQAEVSILNDKLKLGGYAAQHWQTAIEVDGPAALPTDAEADSGFARLRLGIWLNGQITDNISFFVELAEEPNDAGDGNYDIRQDLAFIDYKVNDAFIIRFGNVVETTMNFLRYSDGGNVQSNPLIGNGINNMITAAEGIWFTGTGSDDSGKWDYNLTITKPSFFGDASKGSGYNYGLRGTYTLESGLGFGAGYFTTDGQVSCTTSSSCSLSDGGAFGDLIALGDGDNYDFASKTLNARRTQPGIVPGIQADIWQLDLIYQTEQFLIHGFCGQARDDYSWASGVFGAGDPTIFSETDSEQQFWGLEAKYSLSEAIYLAGRYGVSNNESDNLPTGDEEANRLQLGLGWWFDDKALLKAEYVKQEEGSVSAGGRCQFDAGQCEWDGFVIEASISF